MSWRSTVLAGVLALGAALAPRTANADTTHACVEAAHEGQRLRDAGKLVSARDAFVSCRAPSCPAVVRESCERWIGETAARIPDIVLGARDPRGSDLYDVRVSVDEKELTRRLEGRAVPVDPGPHELLFEAAGLVPVRMFVVVREGEKLRPVVATFTAAEPAPAAPIVTGAPPKARHDLAPILVDGAVGVASMTAFTILGLSGASERDRLESTCAASQTCRSSDVESARTKLIAADVSLVVGAVALGIAAAFVIAPFVKRSPARPTGRPVAAFGDFVLLP